MIKNKIYKIYNYIYNFPKIIKKRSRSYTFIDRKKNSDNLIYVLSGYKDALWNEVFERLKEYAPEEYDFCIISAGKYVEELDEIACENGWSYLYTKANNVPYIQNLVIEIFKNAKYIWKFDEDMYIYQNYFENMISTYQFAKSEINHNIGFTAPLIPINSYGYIKFLKEIGKLQEYESIFLKGETAVTGNSSGRISGMLWTQEAQKYIWDVTGNFDERASEFQKNPVGYTICPTRFSIGAIMFTREVWEEMKGFPENYHYHYNDGEDEESINMNCMKNARVIICCNNVLVAHFSFGGKYEEMLNYLSERKYLERQDKKNV